MKETERPTGIQEGERIALLRDEDQRIDQKYWITSRGRVWSGRYKRWMSTHLCTKGYKRVEFGFSVEGKPARTRKRAHLLVLQTFGPPKPGEEYTGDHIDGNKLNNEADNLEWVTRSENTYRQMRRQNHPAAKLFPEAAAVIRVQLDRGLSIVELAQEHGVSERAIISIEQRRTYR